MNKKKFLFEYCLLLFSEWYCEYSNKEYSNFNVHNDLSKLKVIKLHFFTCSTSILALKIFNKFCALPYGHVEGDIYDEIDNLDYFRLSNTKLEILDSAELYRIASSPDMLEEISIIVQAVKDLKRINYNIIGLSPFDLVELSHRWFSWKQSFHNAKIEGKFSYPIDVNTIINEAKFYAL